MAVAAPSKYLGSPEAVERLEREQPATRLNELFLRMSDGLVPFSLWLPSEEEFEQPAPSGFWARMRYWFKRLSAAELGNDDE